MPPRQLFSCFYKFLFESRPRYVYIHSAMFNSTNPTLPSHDPGRRHRFPRCWQSVKLYKRPAPSPELTLFSCMRIFRQSFWIKSNAFGPSTGHGSPTIFLRGLTKTCYSHNETHGPTHETSPSLNISIFFLLFPPPAGCLVTVAVMSNAFVVP